MKPQSLLRESMLAFCLIAAVGQARAAAAFAADLRNTRDGETRTTPFHFQDQSYRLELVENGQPLVIIADGQTGMVRVLNPAEKAYYEAAGNHPLSRMTSPFAFYAFYAKSSDVQAQGTEDVGGIPCTRQLVTKNGQDYCTAWFAPEFAFPLKLEIPLFGQTVEVRNLERGPQDTALFAVPADFKLVRFDTEPPPPAWVGEITSAPEVIPPFEKTLAAGEMIRVLPQSGQAIRIQATNTRPETCAFTSVGYKDAKLTGDPSGNTMNLDTDQEVTGTFTQGPSEVDAIVIRGVRGTTTVRATLVPAAPGAAAPAAPEAPPAPDSASSAEVHAPDAVDIAAQFEVTWAGPANNEDYIAVARPQQPPGAYTSLARLREGNPLKIWAPSDPGTYEVRYILGRGAKVLATAPLTVKAVPATVAFPDPVPVAGWIEVTWTGPAGANDYITVALPNQPPGAYASQTPLRQGSPVRLRAPSDPGAFEVRYILGRGNRLLARGPITISPVTATVEPPAAATAGADFDVTWTGPGYPEDFVTVARANQPPGAHLGARPTRQGNPARLRAPREPGVYEIRYVLGRGNRLLAKATINVEAASNP